MITSIASVIILIVAAWYWRVRRYQAAFRPPRRRNDEFACRRYDLRMPIVLNDRSVALPPELLGRRRTAFIEIQVSITLLGFFVDPYIEIEYLGTRHRQYFERGAIGRRYLNISAVTLHTAKEQPQRITLRGQHIHWQTQASLIAFDPYLISDEVVVLAPHPDDAEIAAFGLYSTNSSWIVTITAGERAPMISSPLVPPNDNPARWRALVRAWDSLSVPQLGDVPQKKCLNLVFPDARLELMHRRPELYFENEWNDDLLRSALRSKNQHNDFRHGNSQCNWRELVHDLRNILDSVRPSVVVCPHPLIDTHPDHIFTTVALAEALRDATHRPDAFFLYAIHAHNAAAFPLGPAESQVSLPPGNYKQWIADAIYSLPLTDDMRRMKYLAVESCHDVRVFPETTSLSLQRSVLAVAHRISAFISGMDLNPTTFLRRAPRPNEIYYVVSHEGLIELVTRVLDDQN